MVVWRMDQFLVFYAALTEIKVDTIFAVISVPAELKFVSKVTV
jgi:hypothetical protein